MILSAEQIEYNLRRSRWLVDARSAQNVSHAGFHPAPKYARTNGKADEGGNLKIALIGTHGVGKTTLAYEVCSLLKKSHYNVELVAEVARQSPFPVNAETTLEGQLWILHAQIAAELEAAPRAPIVVTDRAVLDNYCYLVNKFGRQPQLEAWLAWWMETYSLLIGIPIVEEGIPRDGFRSEDRAFQLRIHDLLIELLASAPFNRLPAQAIWLDAQDRSNWAERIVSAALPLIESAPATHLRNRSAR
jgi:AAA domain-containing protein